MDNYNPTDDPRYHQYHQASSGYSQPTPQQQYSPSIQSQHHIPHYSASFPPPQQQQYAAAPSFVSQQPQQHDLMRKRTVVKHIQLTPQGNLVIDIPVPDRVLQAGTYIVFVKIL